MITYKFKALAGSEEAIRQACKAKDWSPTISWQFTFPSLLWLSFDELFCPPQQEVIDVVKAAAPEAVFVPTREE